MRRVAATWMVPRAAEASVGVVTAIAACSERPWASVSTTNPSLVPKTHPPPGVRAAPPETCSHARRAGPPFHSGARGGAADSTLASITSRTPPPRIE